MTISETGCINLWVEHIAKRRNGESLKKLGKNPKEPKNPMRIMMGVTEKGPHMKKNYTKSIPEDQLRDMDLLVPCSWLPDQKIRLSEYQDMITYFVQKYATENLDAKQLYLKEFTYR